MSLYFLQLRFENIKVMAGAKKKRAPIIICKFSFKGSKKCKFHKGDYT
jgi:hypothetical protein